MNEPAAGGTIATPPSYDVSAIRPSAEPLSHLMENTLESIEAYGREKPWSFGLWMMGLGFVLGWKLKIW